MGALILTIVIVTALDFLVTLVDAAIFFVPMHRVRMMAKKSDVAADLFQLREASERPITTLISVANLITVVGSIAVGIVAENVFGERWVWLVAFLLTFVMMVMGEIIPKRLGERYADAIAVTAAPLVLVFSKLFLPLTIVITKVVKPLLGVPPAITSREEIAFLAKLGRSEGILKETEGRMISRIFKLNGITASDMMTPRPFLFMLDGNRTLGEVTTELMESPYSKMPVYEKSPDKIVGVASQHHILKAIADGEVGRQVKEFAEEPLIVPETRGGDALLRDFQEARNNFAIVVDGRGHVTGVITLLDIVEELVGELSSEDEIAPEIMKRISKLEIVAHGATQIGKINRFFNTEIPNHRTLAGFLMDEIGHVPRPGQVFRWGSLEFRVEGVDHLSSVEKVYITKIEEQRSV